MGSVQKEWLIYFYEAEDHPYSDWLFFLRKGYKHCGALSYNTKKDAWFFKAEHYDTLLSMMNPSLESAVEKVAE